MMETEDRYPLRSLVDARRQRQHDLVVVTIIAFGVALLAVAIWASW